MVTSSPKGVIHLEMDTAFTLEMGGGLDGKVYVRNGGFIASMSVYVGGGWIKFLLLWCIRTN